MIHLEIITRFWPQLLREILTGGMNYIAIDKGKQHGIEENMAVITAKGLIGKIKSFIQVHFNDSIVKCT